MDFSSFLTNLDAFLRTISPIAMIAGTILVVL